MQTETHAVGERIAERECATVTAGLKSVDDVATWLNCSARHVRRMADSGAMPRPVKLGASLVRWRAETGDPMTGIRDWLDAGCPSCRHPKGGA